MFTLEHAPEPYLLFGSGEQRCVFLSTNPGQGMPFQLRPESANDRLLKGVDGYAAAAERLGSFYSAPRAPISAAARANIASMIRIAGLFGAGQVLQAEAVPWHSATLPQKRQVIDDLRREEPTFARYEDALRTFLQREPLVLAWSAGTPSSRSGEGLELKAALIGLDLGKAALLELERTDRGVSQALLWREDKGRLRGLFVTAGSATLPATGLNRAGDDKGRLIAEILPPAGRPTPVLNPQLPPSAADAATVPIPPDVSRRVRLSAPRTADAGAISTEDLPPVPSMLIRISREWRPGLTEEQLYERVWRYWRATPQKRRRPPLLAFGVAEERLVAAYWIEGWETYDMASHRKDPDRLDQERHPGGKRVGFKGRPATEYAGFIGKRLTDAPKGQNPVSYLHTDV